MGQEPELRVELASQQATVDGETVTLWCQELYIDGRFDHQSEWTSSIADAVKARREMLEQARSDWCYRDARNEAYRLFHPAA